MSSQDPAADQLLNPFKSRTSVPTYPQCIWDILKDHPDGMTIADILQQLQGEGRRDLSGLKKPNGQVANNLARHPEHFQHVGGNNRLWRLAALQAPSADTYSIAQKAHTAVKSQPAASEPSASDANQEQMVAVSKPPAAATRRSTRSASPTVKLAGNELVGLGCNVWWEGEQEWFPGQIEAWDPAGSTYTVQYADGDMEQGLSFGRYEVYKDISNTQLVKVHDYKAGKYVAQATQPDGDDAVPIDSAAQSAHDNAAPTDTVAWSAEEVETPADTAAISAGDHAVPKHETGQADLAEDDALEVADLGNNNSLVQDTVDSSEEDMPLSALAGRHTSASQITAPAHAPQAQTQAQPQAQAGAQNQAQDQAGAQAPAAPASQRVTRSRKADKPGAKPGLQIPNKVTAPMELSSPATAVVTAAAADADVPAGKDTAAARQGSPESAPAVVTAAALEVPAVNDTAAARQGSLESSPAVVTAAPSEVPAVNDNSAARQGSPESVPAEVTAAAAEELAENASAAGRQGSPEPAPAPAPVEVRTTRSQSRRMSMEASPSVTTSVMTCSALKGQSGGQAAMTKLLPAGRKRSATPAYPPAAPEASPTAAAAASASGDAQGGPVVVSNKKRRSGSVDGDSKQAVAPRRSSRLSIGRTASTPDSSQPFEPTPVSEQDNQAEHSAVAVESAADTTAAKAVVEPSPSVQAQDAPADGPAQAASDNFSQFASKRLSHQQDAPGLQAAAGPAQAAELPTIAEPQVRLLPAPSSEPMTEAAAASTVEGSSPQAAATEPQAAGAAAGITAPAGASAEPNNRHIGPDSLPNAPASSGAHLDASTAELPADDVDQLTLIQPVTSNGTSPEVDAKDDTACPAVADAADALPQSGATTSAVMPNSAGVDAVASPSPIPVTADTATAEAAKTSSVEAPATAAAAGPAKSAASTEAVPDAAANSTIAALAGAAGKSIPDDITTVPAAEPSKAATTARTSAADTSEGVSTRPAETASRAAATVAATAAATASEDISIMPAAAASKAPSASTAEAAVKVPPLVKLPGTTRIGLPSRPGLLGKGGLAGMGPSGGSTHIGPALSRGLLSALPTKAKASSETKQSTSAGSAGQKRKRSAKGSTDQDSAAKAKSGSSRQTSSFSAEGAVSPDDATGPKEEQQGKVGRQSTFRSVSPSVPGSAGPPGGPSPHRDPSQSQPQSQPLSQLQSQPLSQLPSKPLSQPQSQPLIQLQSHLQPPLQGQPHASLQSQPRPLPESHFQTQSHLPAPGAIFNVGLPVQAPELPVYQQQQPTRPVHAEPVRKHVPLHQGIGRVKLRIPDADPDAAVDCDQFSQQHGAPPFLVAKYADWPFTCLWPENPASQPPPLPSRSPSPMSFSKTDPSPPKSSAPSHKQRQSAPDHQGMLPQQPASELSAAPAAAVMTKNQSDLPSATGLKVVPRSAERQAPKRLLDPTVGNKAPAHPYATKSRDAELHAEHAGGRHRGDSRPTSATKSTSRVDSARKTSQSNEAGLSGKAPQKSSADQRGRNISADRDRGHDREHDYDRGHNYDRERDYDRPCDHRRDHDYDRSRRRRSSTSSSSCTSCSSRDRYRRSSRYSGSRHDSRSRYSSERQLDSRSCTQSQGHRRSEYQSRDSHRNSERDRHQDRHQDRQQDRHQDRHYSDAQGRSSQLPKDRDSRDRYG
ncbi:TPA: hypothetical protein ACH3X3_000731 [Trebouxia sp. C0006]